MAHSVSEAAARAVKNSQKKVAETRTSEQRMADIRKNRAAKLFVTPDDQDFLLAQLDGAILNLEGLQSINEAQDMDIKNLRAEVVRLTEQVRDLTKVILPGLEAKIEEFRSVYEAENSSMTFKAERVIARNPVLGAPYDPNNAVSVEDGYRAFAAPDSNDSSGLPVDQA